MSLGKIMELLEGINSKVDILDSKIEFLSHRLDDMETLAPGSGSGFGGGPGTSATDVYASIDSRLWLDTEAVTKDIVKRCINPDTFVANNKDGCLSGDTMFYRLAFMRDGKFVSPIKKDNPRKGVYYWNSEKNDWVKSTIKEVGAKVARIITMCYAKYIKEKEDGSEMAYAKQCRITQLREPSYQKDLVARFGAL